MTRSFPSRGPRPCVRPSHASHPLAAGFRPAAAALAIALVFAVPLAPAQPVPAQVVHGGATFVRNGSNLLVTTTNGPGTSHSAIDWTSFSVPAGSATQFLQPTAASTSINRVIEANPSQIFGRLSSNGRLVLVNPWGITIGQGARVDAAGFTASTLAMSQADAIAGRLRFAGAGAPLKVDGSLRAQGGDIVLIAPTLETGASAVVEADGAAVLAAGQQVEITGRGLEGIVMQVQAGTEAVNLGALKGDAVGIFAGTLKHSGVVQATSARVEGGKVVLRAAGDALVDGRIVAQQGAKGGSVDVLGERVGLLAGASIDASGAAGGGNVRIGGDFRGANPEVPNAQRTYVDPQATIAADATQQGDGGRVVVWADDGTRMGGHLSARGGPHGGDGGSAEVSGKRWLDFTGRVDLRAPAGRTGRLLLDPNDVVITSSHATDTATSSGGVFGGGGDTAYVNDGDLAAQLELADVTVTTSNGSSTTAPGQLTVASDATVHWTNSTALTLHADAGMSIAGTVQADGPSSALNLTTSNAGGILVTGTATAAAVTVQSAGNLEVQLGGTLSALNGKMTVHAGGDVKVATMDPGTTSTATLQGTQGLEVQAAGAVRVGSFWAGDGVTTFDRYAWGWVTDSGTVGVSITGGNDVEIHSGSTVKSWRAPLAITSLNGSILGDSDLRTYGTTAGTLALSAVNGSVHFATLGSSGSYSAPGGGAITITAKNDVQGSSIWSDGVYHTSAGSADGGAVTVTSSAGNINLLQVSSTGGGVSGTAQPGRGGNVTLSAPAGSIAVRSVMANGASGGYSDTVAPVAGAAGGNIGFQAASDISLGVAGSPSSLDASGGTGGWNASSQSATGGSSGFVSIASSGGSVVPLGTVELNANGGGGGSAGGTSTDGRGGAITVSAPHGSVRLDALNAPGGGGSIGAAGGSVTVTAGYDILLSNAWRSISTDGGSASAGAAGAAGSVSLVSAGGNVILAGGISAQGGYGQTAGGRGGDVHIEATSTYPTTGIVSIAGDLYLGGGGAAAGLGGDAGALTVLAGSNVQLANVWGSGGSAPADAVQAGKGAKVEVTSTTGGIVVGELALDGGSGGDGVGGGDGGSVKLTANAPTGSIVANGSISAKGGAGFGGGGLGGSAQFTAGGSLHLGAVTLTGGDDESDLGRGGPGGGFSATTTNGDVQFELVDTTGHTGGPVFVDSGGDLSATAIHADATDAYGEAAGSGGNITLQALSTADGKGNINAGTLSSRGTSSSLGPSGGGTVVLSAHRDIDVDQVNVRGGWYVSGAPAGSEGLPGAISIDSASGSVIANYLYTNGPRPGGVNVVAHQGNIDVDSIYSSGSYSSVGYPGGRINLEALGTGPKGGYVTVTGGLGSYGSSSETGSGGGGGWISVHADKSISVASASAGGGYTYSSSAMAGQGGRIEVFSDNGNISVGSLSANGGYGASFGAGAGGLVHLKALGNTTGGAISSTGTLAADGGWSWNADGGNAGSVTVEASRTVQVYAVSAHGGGTYASIGSSAGGAGGSVYLSSSTADVTVDGTASVAGGHGAKGGNGGRLEVHPAGAAQIADLSAEGGSANAPQGSGGNAGTVIVQAGSDVTVGSSAFHAAGGEGNDGPGGTGAQVTLASSGGSVFAPGGLLVPGGGGTIGGAGGTLDVRAAADLHASQVDASGGVASSNNGGATGGAGGSVTLRFGSTLDSSSIVAEGNSGEPGGAANPNGGSGGAGGLVDVGYTGTATFTLDGLSLSATGGRGGDGYSGATIGQGGRGGKGGIINVGASAGALVLSANPVTSLASSLAAGSGAGGWSGDGVQGPGDLPGQVNLEAATDLSISAMDTDAFVLLSMRAGNALNLDMPIVTDGAPVWLRGAVLNVHETIDTTGRMPTSAGPTAMAASPLSPTTIVGGDIDIAADRLNLQAPVNSGTAVTIVHPLTATRATRLGGSDDLNTLYIAQSQADLITASTLLIGDALNTGGITVGPIAIDPALAPSLSLISQGAITQDTSTGGALTAQNLNASGASVQLSKVTVSVLSGRASSGVFGVANQGTSPLTIGTVDHTSGIAATGAVGVGTAGVLQLADSVESGAAGDAVALAAAQLQAGSTASISTPAGRWLVYLDTLAGNDFGLLRSGNHALWGRSLSANPPWTIAATGNRFLFAERPALDVTANAATKVYDGTPNLPLTFQASGFVDAAQYQNAFLQDDLSTFTGALALQNPSKNVGSYAILQGTLASDYAIRSFTGNTATITPAPLTIRGLAVTKEYDATVAASVGATGAQLGGLVAGDDVAFTGASGTFDDKNVGTAKVVTVTAPVLSGVDVSNYAVSVGPVAGTITPHTLQVSGLSGGSRVYDGTTAAPVRGTAAIQPLANDVVALGGTLTGSFADKNVGTGKAMTVGGLAMTGADAGNYRLAWPSLGGEVTPATLTVSGVKANDKVYDGTTTATLAGTPVLGGLVPSDIVQLTAGAASFADPNAGTAKPVTVADWTLGGADARNYVLQAPGSFVAAITPAPLTINANNLNKLEGTLLTFAGTEFTPAGTGIGNETVTSVALTSAGAPVDAKVGAYPIKASNAAGTNGFIAGNYAITYLDGALAVFAATPPPPTPSPEPITPSAPEVVHVNNQVVTFAALFVEEARIQQTSVTTTQDLEDAKKKKDEGREDVVVTNNTCRPQ